MPYGTVPVTPVFALVWKGKNHPGLCVLCLHALCHNFLIDRLIFMKSDIIFVAYFKFLP